MKGAQRFAVRAGHVSRKVGEEVFVLTADSRMHWMKNETASALWEGLVEAGEAGISMHALVSRLTETFEVGRDEADEAVAAFVADLERAGLIVALD